MLLVTHLTWFLTAAAADADADADADAELNQKTHVYLLSDTTCDTLGFNICFAFSVMKSHVLQ